MKIFACLPFLLPNQNHVSPFLLPNQNHVSPLYSVKVFDILQRKERAIIHIQS